MGYNINSGVAGGAGGDILQSTLVPVRVTDIILDETHPRWQSLGGWDSLGTIFYTGVNESNSTKKPDFNNAARPLFSNLKQYPLKNEIVLIVKAPNRSVYGLNKGEDTYYLPSVNIWSHQHHNALPSKRSVEDTSTKQDYKQTENGIIRQVEDGNTDINLGNYFNEQINIKPLLPFEGDYIIEGRFGNSIRFGATAPGPNDWSIDSQTGNPITIIRNGQSNELDNKGWIPTIEDINRDDSSIYMTSNQKISSLAVASLNFQSYGAEIEEPEDPLTSLVDVPIKTVKLPEPAPISNPQEIEQESNTQDLDDTPPKPEETTTEETTTVEETDSLSFFDEMTSSGQSDPDDFVEYNVVHENTEISGTDETDEDAEQEGESDPPNNEAIEQHEQEKKDLKEGKKPTPTVKDSSIYPYTLTNKSGKQVTLQAPKLWNSLKGNIGPKSSRVKYLILHTTAGNIKGTAVDVMNDHFYNKKWNTGGYHYMIQSDGKVTQCYQDSVTTNGAKDAGNYRCMHISWIGGFDFKEGGNKITKGQAITLVEMIKFYCKRYPDILVFGHNQFSAKLCPWFYVPKMMSELKLTKNMGLTDPQWKLNLNALPSYQKVAQQIAQGSFPLIDLK